MFPFNKKYDYTVGQAEQKANPGSSNPSTAKFNTKNILVAVLVFALVATWAYMIWDKNNQREMMDEKNKMISSTNTQRDLLQKELEDVTGKYDELKTINSGKDSTISAQDDEIERKKKQIKQLLAKSNATKTELEEARNLIASLKQDIENYRQEILVLQNENKNLNQENIKINAQKDKIQQSLDSSISEIEQKNKLIDKGSTLHASSFGAASIDIRRSGKMKETSKAKKVDKFRISFKIDENQITESGVQTLYILIKDPKGKVSKQAELGSGEFTDRSGERIAYTQKMNINYVTAQSQYVSFDWKSSEQYESGNYSIIVYNNGFKIGEGQIALK